MQLSMSSISYFFFIIIKLHIRRFLFKVKKKAKIGSKAKMENMLLNNFFLLLF